MPETDHCAELMMRMRNFKPWQQCLISLMFHEKCRPICLVAKKILLQMLEAEIHFKTTAYDFWRVFFNLNYYHHMVLIPLDVLI